MKKIRVRLNYSWEFTVKEWNEQMEHEKACIEDARIVIENDYIHAFHFLNDICYPKARLKVEIVEEVDIEVIK